MLIFWILAMVPVSVEMGELIVTEGNDVEIVARIHTPASFRVFTLNLDRRTYYVAGGAHEHQDPKAAIMKTLAYLQLQSTVDEVDLTSSSILHDANHVQITIEKAMRGEALPIRRCQLIVG